MEVCRIGVPFRVTVAKVSRPEKTRSVNFGGVEVVAVLMGFWGRGSSRW